MQRQLSDARTQAEQILADAHAAAQREHDKLLSDAQKELKDLAVTATEKLVLQSDGDAFDQFLDAAERGSPMRKTVLEAVLRSADAPVRRSGTVLRPF